MLSIPLVRPLVGLLVHALTSPTDGPSSPPEPTDASLDFSDPDNSQYLALLEDI